MAKVCEGCKSPVTSGQFISIERLSYHAQCFVCFKCKVSCYGKQFAPRGEPGDPNWAIFCQKCDLASGEWVEINYQDHRSKQNKSSAPVQKPVPRKAEPEPEPPPSQERTKKITSIFQQQEEEKARKERLLQLENQHREQAKDTRQIDLERARVVKQKQEEEDRKNREEDKKYRQRQEQEEAQRTAAIHQKEKEYWDNRDQQQNSSSYSGKEPQYISAPVEIEAEEETLTLPSPPQRQQQHHHQPPPPGPSSRGPPPPPSGPSRGPPPPPSGGPSRGARQPPPDVPEETPEKNALLDSIRSFKQRSLRPTETNDRSGPLIDSSNDRSEGSSGSKPGRGPPPGGRGNPLQNQLAATLAMRGKY